ncbi:MAG: type I methionyl aminopeptidase [Candidatus Brocadiia bacterium]|nr:MAG: type I methionyl aminopeptidase [Candidatus Brocadiia bacterium]
MAVAIRSKNEIELIRTAGKIVARILKRLQEDVTVGMTTGQLARISDEIISQAGAIALFKGVPNPQAGKDFPASICASINEQVVHGIPGERKLCSGDIVSIDCGAKLNGYCGDSAVTIMVGQVAPEVRKLVQVTRETLEIAVNEARPGRYWSEVARMMQEHAEQAGFSVVREYVGHGIGRKMHEDPKLPNFVNKELLKNDLLLRKGMILAIEPMVNLGTCRTRVLHDGWTVVTADGKPSAHFEHTVAITDGGAEVLTNLD